jgi:hypothetical protein
MKYLPILLLLTSCYTPNRCARLSVRCGWTSDTVNVHDSIRIDRIQVDSLIHWEQLCRFDTITLQRDRLRVVMIPGTDGVQVQAECKDTVIRYVRQQVVRSEEGEKHSYLWLIVFLSIGIIWGKIMQKR